MNKKKLAIFLYKLSGQSTKRKHSHSGRIFRIRKQIALGWGAGVLPVRPLEQVFLSLCPLQGVYQKEKQKQRIDDGFSKVGVAKLNCQ